MIRQSLLGLAGLPLVAVGLLAYGTASTVPVLVAGFVCVVAGSSALVWAVGLR